MNRSLYGERDYAFGKLILTLRTQIGLTQKGLAERLHISRRAVTEWEAGSTYPTAEHLHQLITLGVRASAFPAGREAEEIRALWHAAHQKVLLDEAWLASLLGPTRPALTLLHPVPLEEPRPGELPAAQPKPAPRLDWGEALAVSTFYDREQELATLARWVVEEGCRMVSVLGMGGMGKSALVVRAMQQLAGHFAVVLFRSLRDAPDCSALLDDCLSVLSPEPLGVVPQSLERRLSLLLEELRSRRVLLVLDNLEVLLEEGEVLGHLRPGFEAYDHLLRQVAQTGHQSCLLLTSREKPAALRALEGSRTPVRSLPLSGLNAASCEQLLAEHEVMGSPQERARLGAVYAGNPLALNIVAETIADLFGGQIDPFLAGGTVVFGSITELLDEQWARLSPLEQTVLYWLAILREQVTLQDLLAVLVDPLAHVQVLEAVDGLRRRSLIERGQRAGSFTLQSVVLEYVTTKLVTTASQEIEQGRLLRLRQHGLSQAQAKEYVRQTQERLLLAPLLARLQSMYQGRAEVEGQLRALLDALRERTEEAQGYGPANLVALLRLLRGELRGLDLSHVTLRGVSLQGVELQDATLSGAMLRECVFTETFDAITAVAISRSGQYWAALSRRGEVRVWREGGKLLHLAWQAHTDTTYAFAFSPDEHTLASGSNDGSVKLWEVESGALLWSGWHMQGTMRLAFSPDGSLLASGGVDATVRLWDPKLGAPLAELPHSRSVGSLTWSPDGRLLATGDVAGTIRLWAIPPSGPATCVQTLPGHRMWVPRLAFSHDGSRLASASWDNTVKLWELASGRCLQTLVGHTERVEALAWSPDGGMLASGSLDHTIRLWDGKLGRSRAVLQGHSGDVQSLAFTPDSRHLLSGSDDGTLRLWEVESSLCVRVMQGYTASLYDLDWSPDGTQLVSGGTDTLVIIWDVAGGRGGTPPRALRGHRWDVCGVGWSPDGDLLASASWDHTIRLWDPANGSCLQILGDPDNPDTVFFGVAFSPDGKLLANGTFLRSVLVWDMSTRSLRWADRAHAIWLRRLAWSPDSRRVASGGDDGSVYLWDATDGTLQQQLAGHQGVVMSVAWSPDGRRLASVGSGRGGGELFVWEAHSWERTQTLVGQAGMACAVAWGPSGERLVSGGGDGTLRWWEVQSGECVRVREAHQGTVQALKVSPDGSMLASCGDDGAIRLWDLESGEPLQTLRRDRPYERLTITGIRGLTQAQKATLRALGAVEDEASHSP